MKCIRTISVISVIALAILILGSDAVLGTGVQITARGSMTDYYVKSDPACGSATVVWNDETRKHYRDDPGGGLVLAAAQPAVDIMAPGTTSWRLEFGYIDDFDWPSIKEALRLFHGVEVGAVSNCHVVHWMKPVECHSVQASFYLPYERKFFEVRNCASSALISVLVPSDGVAVVYNDVHIMRGSTYCTNASRMDFASSVGVCAGVENTPYVGPGCNPGTNKWKPMDHPALDDRDETATWGKIKAVYGD